jgi:hypothetical protein
MNHTSSTTVSIFHQLLGWLGNEGWDRDGDDEM